MNLIIDDLDYAFEVEGTGMPLVLLHGFTGSGENWNPLIPVLRDRFTVVTVDLPGHGRTGSPDDPARYRIERAAQDLLAILDHLNFDHATLLGYSMGGRLALFTGLTSPQRFTRLILESASPGLETAEERQARVESDEKLAERIEREGIPAFVDYWENIPLFESQKTLPEDVRDRIRRGRLRNNPRGLANSLRGMGTGVQPALWSRLGEVTIPVTIIAGELDGKFTAIARRMHGFVPQSELHLIKNAGHTPHLEQPGAFLACIG